MLDIPEYREKQDISQMGTETIYFNFFILDDISALKGKFAQK